MSLFQNHCLSLCSLKVAPLTHKEKKKQTLLICREQDSEIQKANSTRPASQRETEMLWLAGTLMGTWQDRIANAELVQEKSSSH